MGGHFAYNTAVLHVNIGLVHTTYFDRGVFHDVRPFSRASFKGPGGIDARPSAGELAAARQQRFGATAAQMSHQHAASMDHANFASENHGSPAGTFGNRAGAENHAAHGAERSGSQQNHENAGSHSGGKFGSRGHKSDNHDQH